MPQSVDSTQIQTQQMADLIDLIYAVAMDARQWPLLVQALSETLDHASHTDTPPHDQVLPNNRKSKLCTFLDDCYNTAPLQALTGHEVQNDTVDLVDRHSLLLGNALLPHIERAATLAQQLHHSRETTLSLENVLDHIPIGILIVDAQGMVLGENRRATYILKNTASLSIQHGRITTDTPGSTTLLYTLIADICMRISTAEECARTFTIKNNRTGSPLSLLITPSPRDSSGEPQATLFIAAPDMHINIPLPWLQELYGLTHAEARLVHALVNGKDISRICSEHNISNNTARTHLKAVFSKTGTSRQSDLIRLILTGPAIITEDRPATATATADTHRNTCHKDYRSSMERNDRHVTLADGRTLGYREYGDANGIPVIHMHTMPASRQQMHPDPTLPTRLGIRLIVPDRPGIGLSTPQPGRSILDWCNDIKELGQHTGLDKFGVIGYGAGTPYALAVAASFPDVVTRVAIASAVYPDYSLLNLRGIGIIQRMLYTTARTMPALLVQLIRQSAHAIRKDPDKYIDILIKSNHASDMDVLSDPRVKHNLKTGYLDASTYEGQYTAHDALLLVGDWGFELNRIRTPVYMWHGENNRQNPMSFSICLAKILPCCKLKRLPDAGHFLIYTKHWSDILSYAAGF